MRKVIHWIQADALRWAADAVLDSATTYTASMFVKAKADAIERGEPS